MTEIRPVPEGYRDPCSRGGRLEEAEIPGFPYTLVYLPAGYDESDGRYSVFYLLHGGGGDQHAFFREDGIFKNMIDHMIENGDIPPMIIAAPTYYPEGTRDRGVAFSADAVRDFGPILLQKILPVIDGKYRTEADRRSRGIGGFSMGAVVTWYVLMAGTEQFHWFMPLSGDCWICGEKGGNKHARQTASLMADTLRNREFYLHALTGSEDIAFPNLDPQMQAMKKEKDVFAFGKNTFYSVLEGGVHDYPDIYRYIFNALPEFFR